ncbi:hypothetical protein VP01_3708g1, partial [Puccinia sorghi]
HYWCVCCAFETNPPKQLSHNDQLDDWENNVSEENEASSEFQDFALLQMQKELPSIIVPHGVNHIPLDLGNPKHGKLKARKWNDLAYCGSGPSQKILLSFSSLVICTNLVSMKSILDANSNKFAEAYLLYTDTSTVIFPLKKALPNPHYALQFPEQLRWWGPLSNVSKFPGERVNGILQKMKTNGKLDDIEGTVLREFCQTQWFHSQTANLLFQLVKKMGRKQQKQVLEVHELVYVVMLQKLQSEDSTLQHYQDVPHHGSSVVTRYVCEEDSFTCTSGLFSKSKQNWLVMYCKDHDPWRIRIAIKYLCDACMGDKINIDESFLQMLSDLELKVVFSVCAYRYLPPATFKYHLPLIVLRPIPNDLSPFCTRPL